MRTTVAISLPAAVLLAMTAASAQVPRPGTQPPLPAPQPPAIQKTGETVTLVGCVKPAAAPAATEAGRPPMPAGQSSLAAHEYLLTNVEDRDQPSNKEGRTYALSPATGVNIAQHVGHKVQVTGLLQKVDPPMLKPTDPEVPKAAERPTTSAWPIVSVTSLMMVSSACGTTRD